LRNKQLIEENKKLKLLLEDRRNKGRNQAMQNIGQITPNISTRNRFEVLDNVSYSVSEDMELDEGEEEEKSFIQILKNKNNKRPTKNNSQLSNSTQSDIQSAKTLVNRHNTFNQNTQTNKQDKKSLENTSSPQVKLKEPPPINIFNQDPKDTWKLAKEIMSNATFHIKRINDNKHILQVDRIDNFKKKKNKLYWRLIQISIHIRQKKIKILPSYLKV